jgi:hypothetical protein
MQTLKKIFQRRAKKSEKRFFKTCVLEYKVYYLSTGLDHQVVQKVGPYCSMFIEVAARGAFDNTFYTTTTVFKIT